MLLHSVRLRNIACFEDQTFDFTRDNKPCKTIILLGENGTGKSTTLQMIALSLMHIQNADLWVNKKSVRNPEIDSFIDIALKATQSDPHKNIDDNHVYKVESSFLGDLFGRTFHNRDDRALFKKPKQGLYSSLLTTGWFACAYGPWRTIDGEATSKTSKNLSSSKKDRFATMFSIDRALMPITDWLLDLEFRVAKEPKNKRNKRIRQLAIDALEVMLPGLKFVKITADSKVIFKENGQEVLLNQLSDGYRSTAAWVGDLVRRLVEAFPDMDNPLEAEGVVLVDEIDIHLHPKWQQTVVENVRKLFPNIQFIMSSHSPFVAQDMREMDKIIVLKKQEDGTVIAQDSTQLVHGWRVDQILTSNLFGLETTRDHSVYNKEKDYQELLNLQMAHQLTPEQKERLTFLKGWIRENKSLPGESADENDLYDVAQSLIGILDQKLGLPSE